MPDQNSNIIALIVTTIATILMLVGFIISILYLYQNKQINYTNNLETIKLNHDKNLLQAQLEIKERTLQEVSRDIHDDISLSLTLSKLHLNTLSTNLPAKDEEKVAMATKLIGEAIEKLRNISKSLNSNIIETYGLMKAIENEIEVIHKSGVFKVHYNVSGQPSFLDSKKELLVFRIIQESLNNIIKHARATKIYLYLDYHPHDLDIQIQDNGIGFVSKIDTTDRSLSCGSGLSNIVSRTKMLQGKCCVSTSIGNGTIIRVSVPLIK